MVTQPGPVAGVQWPFAPAHTRLGIAILESFRGEVTSINQKWVVKYGRSDAGIAQQNVQHFVQQDRLVAL
jgi:hypothetical protein